MVGGHVPGGGHPAGHGQGRAAGLVNYDDRFGYYAQAGSFSDYAPRTKAQVAVLYVYLRTIGCYDPTGRLVPTRRLVALRVLRCGCTGDRTTAVSYTHLTLPTICSV
eukprot:3109803-Rhodomonas_salina.1